MVLGRTTSVHLPGIANRSGAWSARGPGPPVNDRCGPKAAPETTSRKSITIVGAASDDRHQQRGFRPGFIDDYDRQPRGVQSLRLRHLLTAGQDLTKVRVRLVTADLWPSSEQRGHHPDETGESCCICFLPEANARHHLDLAGRWF
jgi:hypothetical protein